MQGRIIDPIQKLLTETLPTDYTKLNDDTQSTTWTNEGDGMFTGKNRLRSTRKMIKIVNLRDNEIVKTPP